MVMNGRGIPILYDIIDWYEDKFQEAIPSDIMKEIATIVSYNIFQMDGVTMCVPYSEDSAKVMNWELDEMERFDGQPEELSLF